jgi:hypothetical protein
MEAVLAYFKELCGFLISLMRAKYHSNLYSIAFNLNIDSIIFSQTPSTFVVSKTFIENGCYDW